MTPIDTGPTIAGILTTTPSPVVDAGTATAPASPGSGDTAGPSGLPTRPNLVETTDIAGSTATTAILAIGQSAQGTITSSDHDWYRVDLVAGHTYSFAMIGTGAGAVADTYLTLRDAAGTSITADDDNGPALSSRITYTASATGSFYLDAAGFDASATGQYGISATEGSRPDFDDVMGAGAIDGGTTWSTRGTAATVTYGFRQTAAAYTVSGHNISTFSQLSAPEMTAVQQILQLWSDTSNITFNQVNPGGYTDNATILIANYTDSGDGAGAFAFFPGSTASTAQPGDVWLNLGGGVSTSAIPVGSYSFFAIMHEFGHALGLSHPGDYNAAPGVTITYANSAQFTQDSEQYSVMSYFGGSNTGSSPGGFASGYTPMMLDILEMQTLYGVNTATRAGDTVYGFNSTAGSIYAFVAGTAPQYAIWDGGGVDTIDASGYGQAQVVSLIDGTFSSIGGGTSNISIALNAVIENAIGGSGADTITGNAAANVLTGGAGADTLTGGAGADAFKDVAANLSGDTIVDFAADDRIWITDAVISTFTYSFSIHILTYALTSGGTSYSLTISSSFTGGLAASSDAQGGVDLTIVNYPPPVVVGEAALVLAAGSKSGTGGTSGTGALKGDSDPSGLSLSISAMSGGTIGQSTSGLYGHLTLNANGSYQYSADVASAIAGYPTGTHPVDVFAFTVSNGFTTTNSTLSLYVDRLPINSTKTVSVVGGTTFAATAGTGGTGALGGDGDPDGDALSITGILLGTVGVSKAGVYGHLTVQADGSYSYVADGASGQPPGVQLQDTFLVTVDDSYGGQVSEALVFNVDRSPVIASRSALMIQAAGSTAGTAGASGSGLLSGGSDADLDPIAVTRVIAPSGAINTSVGGTYGHLTVSANGAFGYTADKASAIAAAPTGLHPVDAFTYEVGDGRGGTVSATFSIPINRSPVTPSQVVLDFAGVTIAKTGGTAGTGLLGGDSDPDGDGLSVTGLLGGAVGASMAGNYGHLTVQADGSYSYMADLTAGAPRGVPLQDVFIVTISDGFTSQTEQLAVNVDRAPIAAGKTMAIQAGSSLTGTGGTGLLAGASDADGDALSVAALSGGTIGTAKAGSYGHLTLGADGSYAYAADGASAIASAATGSHPHDVFGFTVSDGRGGLTGSTLDVTLNRAPVAAAETASVLAGASVSETGGTSGSGLLKGDVDPDGDTLSVTALSGGTIGTAKAGTFGHLTLNADGSYLYAADLVGSTVGTLHDTFSFTVADGWGGSAASALDVTVSAPEHLNAIFRFYDTVTSDHFYTSNPAEKAAIQASLPTFAYEHAPWATPDKGADTLDVFRFFDTVTKTHFLTNSVQERDNLIATLPSFAYEGVAFEAYAGAAGDGRFALERFYNTNSNVHTYAADANEIALIKSGAVGQGWVDEGASLVVHTPTPDMLLL